MAPLKHLQSTGLMHSMATLARRWLGPTWDGATESQQSSINASQGRARPTPILHQLGAALSALGNARAGIVPASRPGADEESTSDPRFDMPR